MRTCKITHATHTRIRSSEKNQTKVCTNSTGSPVYFKSEDCEKSEEERGRPRRNISVIHSAVMAVSVRSTSKEPLSDPLGNDGCSTLDQRHSYVLGVRKQTKILTAVICLIYFMRTLVSVFYI